MSKRRRRKKKINQNAFLANLKSKVIQSHSTDHCISSVFITPSLPQISLDSSFKVLDQSRFSKNLDLHLNICEVHTGT